jgi:hypothetical protein
VIPRRAFSRAALSVLSGASALASSLISPACSSSASFASAAPDPLPVEVAAYYYPNYHPDPRNDAWYGPGWTEWDVVRNAKPRFEGHQQPITPAWGYFDESDPTWASTEIALAADNGITSFLYDWYWYDGAPYLQAALEKGFLRSAERHRLKFALMWANHNWSNIQPAHVGRPFPTLAHGALSADAFERMTDYVADRYLTQPNYLTLDGKAYFSIYELATFVAGQGDIPSARAALDRFREKALAAGHDGLHLNGIVWGIAPASASPQTVAPPLPDTVALAQALGLDSVASYTWFHHHEPQAFPRGRYENALARYTAWCERCRRFPLDYHPNATMGWDPSPRAAQDEPYEPLGYPWTSILDGNTPELFGEGLRRAQAYLDRPQPSGTQQRLVTLNAWNEWTEGSYLLPDARHGMAYLDQVRGVFGH